MNLVMNVMDRALEFENRKMSGMTTSNRVEASREVKALILELNEIYKKEKSEEIMDVMKRLTVIKRKIEKRLNGNPTV
tara:strand:- start:218916 stop:219149 length:234 start_codon:yes stop_codon:yes gene_type:complete